MPVVRPEARVEEALVTPTINVNLRSFSCECGPIHQPHCDRTPILIPCPIPPSVTVIITENKCRCRAGVRGPLNGGHWSDCKGTDVRTQVSADIIGNDWHDAKPVGFTIGIVEASDHQCMLVRDRWALVKALVMGESWGDFQHVSALGERMSTGATFAQRDAVYAALAEQARLEVQMLAAQQRTVAAIGSPRLTASERPPEDRPSAQALEVFVERVIEQVGALS